MQKSAGHEACALLHIVNAIYMLLLFKSQFLTYLDCVGILEPVELSQ